VRRVYVSLIAVATLSLAACSPSPTAPPTATGMRVYVNIVGMFSNVTDGRLGTSGGNQFQLQARLQRDRGGEVVISSGVQWSTSNSAVATVSQTGLLTTLGLGDATITAVYLDYTVTVTVQVQE
jgi:hypothetical protein